MVGAGYVQQPDMMQQLSAGYANLQQLASLPGVVQQQGLWEAAQMGQAGRLYAVSKLIEYTIFIDLLVLI